jgi:hypothetical protein
MPLDAYRTRAEEFLAELTDAYRRHYAGLTDDYPADAIYARYGDLFTVETVATLRDGLIRALAQKRRPIQFLLDFAIEGLIGHKTRELEAALAQREAALTVEAGGRTLPFRQSATVQANEPDAASRAELEQARLDALETALQPLYVESLERTRATSAELGYSSYAAMCAELKNIDLLGLASQTAAFLEQTESPYPDLLAPPLRDSVGIAPAELRRADLPRFFRAAELDGWFPPDRLVSALTGTLQAAGINVEDQPGVALDVEPRPRKSPRAFCAPVRVPGNVHLVIAPIGGRDDYVALMHEGGHTEHYAHVDAALPFEYRCLGDNAITECHAFLLQHLTDDPEWLQRRLGVPESAAQSIAAHGRAVRLVYLRRYAGKLAYELELHGADPPTTSEARVRYAELVGGALAIPWPREPYLADVDAGFYVSCYLRAWALEAHLRHQLRAAFGPVWFEQREAWAQVRELWRGGQRVTPAELLAELGSGPDLDFSLIVADLGI